MKPIVYKFSSTAVEECPDLGDIKKFLEHRFSGGYVFGIDNLLKGYYLWKGWRYELTPFLKKYLYESESQSGTWYEAYAPNVKSLRIAAGLNKHQIVIKFPK